VVGRDSLNRQAAALLRFAKATTDPKMAAGLVEKAAELKERAEERSDDGGEAPDAPAAASLQWSLECPKRSAF